MRMQSATGVRLGMGSVSGSVDGPPIAAVALHAWAASKVQAIVSRSRPRSRGTGRVSLRDSQSVNPRQTLPGKV